MKPEEDQDPAVSVDGLRKVYGTGEDSVEAVKGVSFDVQPETVVGILGPNGAGKTTMIKSMLSLIVPEAGTVRVHGIDLHEETKRAFRHVGAMLEGARNTYWRLTVRENLHIFSVIADNDFRSRREDIDGVLEQFDLAGKADTVVRELSRGQQQKVSLACTLVQDPDILFLDEPTLGLDVESSIELRQELRELVDADGRTVLLSSHDMKTIQETCDRVIIMHDGKIVRDAAIDALLDVFDSNICYITVDGELPQQVRRTLRANVDIREISNVDNKTRVTFRLFEDELTQVIDVLREAKVKILHCDTVDPDLEDIFLDITGSDRVQPIAEM